MTVPLTVGSFSSHSAMVVLNESSLLVRCRRMGRCAGAFRYLRMVCPPMRRCCAILRIGQCSDQYRRCRSLICSVESMSAILFYPVEAACAPGRCCLQHSETGGLRARRGSRTQTWAGTELLFARCHRSD